MPYGGIRRRPGPLLGGSAILAKRNTQQRLQYLQQLQTIVQQKGNEQGYGKVETANGCSSQFSSNNTSHNSYGVNIKLPENNSVDESLNQFKTSDFNISNPYPDLLSHEIPRNSMNSNLQSINASPSSQILVQSYGEMYYSLGKLDIYFMWICILKF